MNNKKKKIAGFTIPVVPVVTEVNCYVCSKKIAKARMEALELLGVPINEWCCVTCSQVQKKQGIFLGEVGTSELKLVDRVYDDNIHKIFDSISQEEESE